MATKVVVTEGGECKVYLFIDSELETEYNKGQRDQIKNRIVNTVMWMKIACSLGWAAVKNYQEEYKDKMHESQEARDGSKGYRLSFQIREKCGVEKE